MGLEWRMDGLSSNLAHGGGRGREGGGGSSRERGAVSNGCNHYKTRTITTKSIDIGNSTINYSSE